ncbi:MAG: PKD domain-containing protein [Euryarchaeota archaeon]|nr:PKD domain-containing protein [Euryarchaeota archaeon]
MPLMDRTLTTLVSCLLLALALSGCFGGDGDDEKDDDTTTGPGNGTPPADNNTTVPPEPNLPPIAFFNVTVQNATESSEPWIVRSGQNATFVFDASASRDPDGNITNYVWKVTKGTREFTSADAVFRLDVANFGGTDAGVYEVTLRVVDDDFNITEIRDFLVVSYEVQWVEELTIVGPGTYSRSDARENEAGSDLQGTGTTQGTWAKETLTVTGNATKIELDLAYTPGTTGKLGLYLFKPDDDHESAEPLAEAQPAASPVNLSVDEVPTSGGYTIRIELDGDRVEGYTLTANVIYAAPSGGTAGESTDEETEDGGEE